MLMQELPKTNAWKKTHENLQKIKMHIKNIKNALRFGRLFFLFNRVMMRFQWWVFGLAWFVKWNDISIFQEQTSSSFSSLRVTISVNVWKGQCYWPFSPLNHNLRSYFLGEKSIMCFEIIHETFKQISRECPAIQYEQAMGIWIKLNKSCCDIHEVEWAT